MKAKHFEDNGKIVATISQGTEEGLEMQANADTRGESSECHYESVFVEYDVCNGFVYEDPEYGLGFGSECRKVGYRETSKRNY